MKAEYKPKEQPVTDLVKGKLYDVQDIKRKTQEEWLLIENESKQKAWYRKCDFVLHAEAAMYIENQTAAGAGQAATQPLTAARYIGIDMATGTDMTAIYTAKEIGLMYGA